MLINAHCLIGGLKQLKFVFTKVHKCFVKCCFYNIVPVNAHVYASNDVSNDITIELGNLLGTCA